MEDHISTYGLVGYPVDHSLSPLMHNTAFQALELAAVYKLFPLTEEELGPFFQDVKQDGSPIFGLNVTVPYKEKVIPFMDALSPFAKKINAVNTVVVGKDRQLMGHNTDGPGFLAHLTELGFQTQGKKIAILGAGGAARAIVTVLAMIPERPDSIRIYDIDKFKADHLILDLSSRMDLALVSNELSLDDLGLEEADILINCTPIGMKADDPLLIDPALLHPGMLVYDVVYNPAQTALLQVAKQKGAETANGLGMLFYQGVLAFEHWAQIPLSQDIKDRMWQSLQERKVL